MESTPEARHGCAAAVTLLAVLVLAAPASAAITPGEILVGDLNPVTGDGAVIKVDPLTGKQTLLSSNALAVNMGSSEFIDDPYGLAVTPSGQILVAEEYSDGSGGSSGSLIGIDPNTGKQTLLAANPLPGPDLFVDPTDVAFVSGIGVVISDHTAFAGGDGGLIKVIGSTESVLSSNDQLVNAGSSEFFDGPKGVTSTPDANLVVAGTPGVLRVDRNTGKQTVLSSNAQPINASSMLFVQPYGIKVEPDGGVLVADSGAFGEGGVIGVNPATGKQSVVSSNLQQVNFGTSELLSFPEHLVRLPDGDLAVVQDDADAPVVRVDRATGKQSLLSSNAQGVNASSMLFDTPYAIAVVPPRCQGSFATLYGTPGTDILRASPFPDVISGLAGNDVILGLGADDRVCGDAGDDRLVGGKGKDRLFGGPGRDLLFGGAAKDRLFGGAGRDRLFGGAGRDRLFGGPGRDLLRGGAGRDVQVQ